GCAAGSDEGDSGAACAGSGAKYEAAGGGDGAYRVRSCGGLTSSPGLKPGVSAPEERGRWGGFPRALWLGEIHSGGYVKSVRRISRSGVRFRTSPLSAKIRVNEAISSALRCSPMAWEISRQVVPSRMWSVVAAPTMRDTSTGAPSARV